jgi:CubicO group peptidase (beta-lactamase class C family)
MRTQLIMKLTAIVVSAVAGLALVQGVAAPMPRATPDTVGISDERLQLVTALLRQFVADHKIAGAVAAVARRGKIVYLEPVGLQNRETRAPMTERSLFRIYSMTKAVTAAGVMMLVEEDKLHLAEPVAKYLPEFKNAMLQEGGTGAPRRPSRDVTIQDLLLHT